MEPAERRHQVRAVSPQLDRTPPSPVILKTVRNQPRMMVASTLQRLAVAIEHAGDVDLDVEDVLEAGNRQAQRAEQDHLLQAVVGAELDDHADREAGEVLLLEGDPSELCQPEHVDVRRLREQGVEVAPSGTSALRIRSSAKSTLPTATAVGPARAGHRCRLVG